MKIMCICFIFLLMGCESKRLIFKTDIVLKDSVQFNLKKEFRRFGYLVEGKEIHPNLEKRCIGVLKSNSVLICKKGFEVTVLSFYKITNKNKSMDMKFFMADRKNGEEEQSYKIHLKIVKDFKSKSSQIENSLTSKRDLLSILKGFSD